MGTIIGENIFEILLKEAAVNQRLRTNFDLRGSESDTSQRMLNALMPGTRVPIHRHLSSPETVILLKGCIAEIYFDDNGTETERIELNADGPDRGVQISPGTWHTIEVHEPSVIIEMKDGSYLPPSADEIMR